MDKSQIARKLMEIPFFNSLDHNQIRMVVDIATQRIAGSGEVLCQSRSVDQRLLILLDGPLRLESIEGSLLGELSPVRAIGEMGVFTGQIRSSRVVARKEALILEISGESLQELIEEDPNLGQHMLTSLIGVLYARVHDVNEEVNSLRQQLETVHARLRELSPDDPLLQDTD